MASALAGKTFLLTDTLRGCIERLRSAKTIEEVQPILDEADQLIDLLVEAARLADEEES